jgi:hypothetical protein
VVFFFSMASSSKPQSARSWRYMRDADLTGMDARFSGLFTIA